jgi:hypothetical protein
MAVIEAVAEAADVDPIELGPLTDTVDPDALNTLFDSIDHERTETVRELTLRFEGRQVTVHSTGELFVQPLGPAARF